MAHRMIFVLWLATGVALGVLGYAVHEAWQVSIWYDAAVPAVCAPTVCV